MSLCLNIMKVSTLKEESNPWFWPKVAIRHSEEQHLTLHL